jgi:SWIM zinc finger
MTQSAIQSLLLHTVQQVSTDRLQRAVCGLADGSFTVTLTRQSESELRALVKNGDGKEYGVTLTETLTTCSCQDSLYRGTVCKHAVALALFVLRNPQPVTRRQWHVGDTIKRNGHVGKVVCVSGEFVSICWDTGRIYPVERKELERV